MNISQKAIKVASVFSGIGSPEFALLRANIPHKLIFACDNGEIECLESDDIIIDKIKNLSEDNKRQIYIPEGFAHGFITLTDNCEVIYKVDKFYDANLDRSVAWNDPEICFEWGISNPILSEKDREASYLKDSDINF